MSRNYQKENEWEKTKYIRIQSKIDKELGIAFKTKLKEKNINLSSWLKKEIEEFLKNN